MTVKITDNNGRVAMKILRLTEKWIVRPLGYSILPFSANEQIQIIYKDRIYKVDLSQPVGLKLRGCMPGRAHYDWPPDREF